MTNDNEVPMDERPFERPVRPLTDEQAAHLGRELARMLNEGAVISARQVPCLYQRPDGSLLGGLDISYGSERDLLRHERDHARAQFDSAVRSR